MFAAKTRSCREIWGILGGMGPLASAEFLKSIYEDSICGPEQGAPIVLLRSDPTIPDRSETLRAGNEHVLIDRLTEGIGQLLANGATRVIICCVTIHHLIPELPSEWQNKIVSLVDVIYSSVLASPEKRLLVCTIGARRMRLFERHSSWPEARDRIILPSEEDQAQIHHMLYDVKGNRATVQHVELLEKLVSKYGVRPYIAGCTEGHILAKQQERLRGANRRHACIDPLTEIIPLVAGRIPAHTVVPPATGRYCVPTE